MFQNTEAWIVDLTSGTTIQHSRMTSNSLTSPIIHNYSHDLLTPFSQIQYCTQKGACFFFYCIILHISITWYRFVFSVHFTCLQRNRKWQPQLSRNPIYMKRNKVNSTWFRDTIFLTCGHHGYMHSRLVEPDFMEYTPLHLSRYDKHPATRADSNVFKTISLPKSVSGH